MKYVRRLVFLALIVGYFLWPYQQVKKFGQAILAQDASAVANMIDEDAFKESMKELAIEAAVIYAEANVPAGVERASVRRRVKEMLETGPLAAQFDQQLKPETLTRRMFIGHDPVDKKPTNEVAWRNEKWVNPVTFSVQDLHSEARAIFKFRGLGWKLVGLEVSNQDLRRYMPMAAGGL